MERGVYRLKTICIRNETSKLDIIHQNDASVARRQVGGVRAIEPGHQEEHIGGAGTGTDGTRERRLIVPVSDFNITRDGCRLNTGGGVHEQELALAVLHPLEPERGSGDGIDIRNLGKHRGEVLGDSSLGGEQLELVGDADNAVIGVEG